MRKIRERLVKKIANIFETKILIGVAAPRAKVDAWLSDEWNGKLNLAEANAVVNELAVRGRIYG